MEKNWENKVNFNLNLKTGKTSVGFWLKLLIIGENLNFKFSYTNFD